MLNNELLISYGHRPQNMIRELLETLRLQDVIPVDARIGLKPNLVVARPAEEGATTSPELVEGVIQYLQNAGFTNLVILEGSWIGDRTSRAFEVCGYSQLAEIYGVELIDLQRDGFETRVLHRLELQVCAEMAKLDYLINLPVLKGHCQTKITCALKNLKGCIPNNEKRRFHTLGLHKPIAYLNKILRTDLIIVDGLIGDLDFEEGGNPVQMDRIIVGTDPVLVDSYIASLLGYEPDEIPYITLSAELGVGQLFTEQTKLTVLNTEHTHTRIKPTRSVEHLASFVEENDACSACYGSLIHALGRLNERGLLPRLPGKIAIGQGFKGHVSEGLGVGNCTKGFEHYATGCPPTAKEILDYLLDHLK